jgi:hypothetical protein
MVNEKRFFINKDTVHENYSSLYPEDNIKKSYIEYIMRKNSLRRRQKKILIK